MIKYRLDVAGLKASITLKETDPNTGSAIVVKGDPEAVETVNFWLSSAYGAFGHLIGNYTTPIDLAAAMNKSPSYIEVVESSGPVPQKFDPKIPKDAMT